MFPVIVNRKIRAAIVGCGRISKNHFGSIEKHAENIDLVAICDSEESVLEEHKKFITFQHTYQWKRCW